MRIVPPSGPPRVLALAQLTNSVGDGAYYVTSALYFSRVAGLSPTRIGLGLTLCWAVGAVAGVPLGHLADRLGARDVAVVLAVATAGAVGAALGGLALISPGAGAFLAILAVDAVSFLLSAPLLLRLPRVAPSPAPADGEPVLAVLRDRPYALVTLLNTVMMLYMPLLGLAIPLWIVRRTEAPSWTVSALLVLNTVSVMLFQVRAARRATGLAAATRLVQRSGAVMLAACAVFALSAAGTSAWSASAIMLAGAVLQVVGEMLLASGGWEIAFTLAPPDRQGQYQGFFGSGTAVARMIGPLLLTTLIVSWGVPGWLLLGGLFLVSGLAMGPAVRRAENHRSPEMTNARRSDSLHF